MDSESVSSSSVQNTHGQEMDLNKEVFGNSVIWDKLSEYLQWKDFLKLRVVNKLFYNMVNDCQSFKNNIDINLTDDALTNWKFKGFLARFPKWKSLSVTLSGKRQRELNSIRDIIFKADVKELRFYWKNGTPTPSKAVGSIIYSFITQMPQITKLEIEFALMARTEIWGSRIKRRIILATVTDFKIFKGDEINVRCKLPPSVFKDNMRVFETALFDLKSFTLEEIPDIDLEITNSKMHLLLRNNCSTLESVVILHPFVWHRTRMNQITCPKLKKLETSVKLGHYQDTFLKAFLRNQPPIESVILSIDGDLDEETLSILNYKHSSNLKTLHIKAHRIQGRNSAPPFQFLSSTALLDFSLVISPRPGYDPNFGIEECEALLRYLPSTIQKLKFEGLQLQPTPAFSRLHFCRLIRCELLTTLEFVRCNGLAGNFQWIKTFCSLKGLEKLTMSHLNLSDRDVFYMKFDALKTLDVSGNKQLSLAFLQKMVCQNPSLEVLTCSQYGIRKDGKLNKIVVHEMDSRNLSDSGN